MNRMTAFSGVAEKFIPDLEFDVLWEDQKIGYVCIKDEQIKEAVQYECDNAIRFLPMCEITIPLMAQLLEARCWDRNRANINEILAKLGLSCYNPFEIVKHTHGTDYDDKLWFRFKGEDLSWQDVDPRNQR